MYPAVHAKATPDKPAYIMAQTGEIVTFKELDDRSNRCAQLFRSLGLVPGDCIAFCMENHPRFLEICWAAQRSGLYYTAISSRLTASEAEYIIDDCGAKVFITSTTQGDVATELVGRNPAVGSRFKKHTVILFFLQVFVDLTDHFIQFKTLYGIGAVQHNNGEQ